MKAISSQAATKPQIGRFTGIDALSEQSINQSAYQFGNNNPVSFNDPTGAYAGNLQSDGYDSRGGLVADPGISSVSSDWSTSATNDFMSAFGEEGGNSGYESGGSSGMTAGGDFYFTGAAAQQVCRALLNAGNHPDDDGNWAFEVGLYKGEVGFWESDYENYSSNGDKGDVDVATHFVSWDDHFGSNGAGPGKGFWQRVEDYFANIGTAGKMTGGWFFDFGAKTRQFVDDRVANALSNSPGVNTLRELYYSKGITHYQYNFGLGGLWNAGLNPIEQYVGSYYVTVTPIEETGLLQFTIFNLTSLRSADYHITPESWNITTGYPMGDFWQTYIFTEPLRK